MTKPRTSPLGAYADCWPILDLAVKNGGVRIPVGSASRATTIRHRLYRARRLLQQRTEAAQGALASTPYDSIIIKLVPHTARGDEPADLEIVLRTPESGILESITSLDGEPLVQSGEELEDELTELKNKLGIE